MRNIRVFVADDESTVRTFIQLVINKEQMPVSAFAEAENGKDAVRIAREFKPDLVFLDIRMPGLDGLQVAEILLADNPKTTIVIVSAYNDFEYARAAFRAGVDDYILKPIRPNEVMEIIKKTAEKYEACADAPQQTVKTPTLVKAVIDYIEVNLSGPLHLRDIAGAVFVSPCHLSRTFKYLAGQSIVDYIQEQRLLKASELLASSDLSITEIAGKVGFNDAAYFATCFKNKMGATPMKYRKTQEIKKI